MKAILIALTMILLCFPDLGEKVIFQESFDYPDGELPAKWWSEGNQAEIKEGRLFVNADTGQFRLSTVWLDQELSGNIRVEFDVHIVSSSDTANNINSFLFYADPNGKPLRDTRKERENGAYTHYHQLNGYIFTYLANGDPSKARVRFRDNPGFNLLGEEFGYECKIGKTYQVMIVREDKRFQFWVNGEKLLDHVDNGMNISDKGGLFGFRTWHTALWWDNLVITQLD